MNKQTQEALKMAIAHFEAKIKGMNIINSNEDILNACKEALEQPAQEPVALPKFPTMLRKMWSGTEVQEWINKNTHHHQWQGLTDEHLLGQLFGIRFQRHTENLMSNPPQIKYSYTIQESDLIKFARAIEQALKEKNYG